MTIINKGFLNSKDVYLRKVGNDWPTAQVITTSDVIESESNLYFTNTRVVSALVAGENITIEANGRISASLDISSIEFVENSNVANTVLTISNFNTSDLAEGANLYFTNTRVVSALVAGDNIEIESNGRISAIIANVSFANTVQTISNFTTEDLEEGNVNLYYTNSRVRSAFSAGRGITIAQSGLISSTIQPNDHNLIDDVSVGTLLSNTLSTVLLLPLRDNNEDRYVLKSIQITNVSENDTYFSGNILFSNIEIQFANFIPLPVGSTAEILTTPQVFLPGDSIKMIGYNSLLVPENNVVSAILTYELRTVTPGLFRDAKLVTQANVETELVDFANVNGVIQSIKLNNLDNNVPKAKISWKNANDQVISYFTYNLPLPINSSIEVVTYPKRLNTGDKLTITLDSNTAVSAIISGRYSDQTALEFYSNDIVSGTSTVFTYSTELTDNTTIYYSFE